MFKIFKKKSNQEPDAGGTIRWGVAAGIAQSVYVGLVALFMNAIQSLGKEPLGGFLPSFLFFLLFFVFSAIVSAILVFGRPIYLVLGGNYKSAVATLLACVLTLLIILVGGLVVILV